MTWAKVIDGPVLQDVNADLAAPGVFRDGEGKPLSGIFARTDQGVETKVLLSHGHVRFGWTYPKLDLVFDSPLVNDRNLYCCVEKWGWADEAGPMDSDLFSVERVAE